MAQKIINVPGQFSPIGLDPLAVTADIYDETIEKYQSEINAELYEGTSQPGPKGDFKSRAFTRTDYDISELTPEGGSYDVPIPNTYASVAAAHSALVRQERRIN